VRIRSLLLTCVRGVALAVGALGLVAGIVALAGGAPGAALAALAHGAAGSRANLFDSLTLAIPLVLTGLAVAVAFRAHLWNIGAEGQLITGMLACVWVGTHQGLPSWLLLPAALGAGALAGAVWAGVAVVLKLGREVPEVISTIMLNFIALRLMSYLVTGPMQERGSGNPQTALIAAAARLPRLEPGTTLHAGVFVALAAAVVTGLLLFRSALGFRLRAVGLSPPAARLARMPVERTLATAFLISGALAGLGGAVEVSGINHRLYEGASPGYGYTAIAVALLGRLHPLGVVLAGLFFGGLRAGSNEMQRSAGVSAVVVYVLQGLVILLVAASPRLVVRSAAKPTTGSEASGESG
jgi:general nucleoside transport system permease protein